MKLGTLTLPGAAIVSKQPSVKRTVYPYPFSNTNKVLNQGIGPTTIMVKGRTYTAATRDAIEAACEVQTEQRLYFPSEIGQTDDRYYKVFTSPAQTSPSHPSNPSYWDYEIECACEVSRPFLTSTDAAVW